MRTKRSNNGGNMKFKLMWASDAGRKKREIEISTLDDLRALEKEEGNPLIISFEDASIWVFNDYM